MAFGWVDVQGTGSAMKWIGTNYLNRLMSRRNHTTMADPGRQQLTKFEQS